MKNKILNLAYIGTGNISNFHIPAFRKAGFHISSISSRKNSKNLIKFAKKQNIKNIIPDWNDLLELTDEYDAIMIAAETKITASILEKTLKTKKPILVEKPVSNNSEIIKKLVNKNQNNIFVAYNRRHYQSTQFAKKFVDSKPFVFANFTLPESTHQSLYQNGCHVIDLLNYFFQDKKLEYISPIMSGKKQSGFISIFKTKRGDIINMISNWKSPSNFKIEFIYKNEKIEMSPIEKAYFYNGLTVVEPDKNNVVRRYVPNLIKESKKEMYEKTLKPGFLSQAKLFYNFVKNKKYDHRLCTLKQAVEVIKTIEQLAPK